MDAPLTPPASSPSVSPSALPPANSPRAQALLEALIEAEPIVFQNKCKAAAATGVGYVIYLGILALRPDYYPTLTDNAAAIVAGFIAFAIPFVHGILAQNATIKHLQEKFFNENAK